MASVRQYGYYIKGNKVAIVEKDTAFDNDANSRDYGPGSNRAQWKSPLATITDGIEVQYVYSPEYYINDADDTKAISAYAESGGLLWFTVASMSATAGDWILIKGSDRWNGLHEVTNNATDSTTLSTNTPFSGVETTDTLTAIKSVTAWTSETVNINLPSNLETAVVAYLKAKKHEDSNELEQKEYYLREFRQIVEKAKTGFVEGVRRISAGAHAIR